MGSIPDKKRKNSDIWQTARTHKSLQISYYSIFLCFHFPMLTFSIFSSIYFSVVSYFLLFHHNCKKVPIQTQVVREHVSAICMYVQLSIMFHSTEDNATEAKSLMFVHIEIGASPLHCKIALVGLAAKLK